MGSSKHAVGQITKRRTGSCANSIGDDDVLTVGTSDTTIKASNVSESARRVTLSPNMSRSSSNHTTAATRALKLVLGALGDDRSRQGILGSLLYQLGPGTNRAFNIFWCLWGSRGSDYLDPEAVIAGAPGGVVLAVNVEREALVGFLSALNDEDRDDLWATTYAFAVDPILYSDVPIRDGEQHVSDLTDSFAAAGRASAGNSQDDLPGGLVSTEVIDGPLTQFRDGDGSSEGQPGGQGSQVGLHLSGSSTDGETPTPNRQVA